MAKIGLVMTDTGASVTVQRSSSSSSEYAVCMTTIHQHLANHLAARTTKLASFQLVMPTLSHAGSQADGRGLLCAQSHNDSSFHAQHDHREYRHRSELRMAAQENFRQL
jgi:hypothetical protein